ncbi:ISL3 family transposase [Streptomyces sp. WM6378]|uniref:ISL3 family transposase n=1 Tax=Streptomyces sp. WM6378 TaxID=1415557 RepID=UPI0006C22EB9|nr:ISL3 family transposase [Streptomyces sp. WM6378]KOU50307.1 transposase [Streptomyces sp. WM6378]
MCENLLELVLPHLTTVLVEHVVVESGVLRITASTKDAKDVPCPGCGSLSVRTHSRYGRRIADAPAGVRPVLIHLSVRRLFCDNPGCTRVTFAEQIDGLTSRYGRRTPALQRIVGALGVVLAARAVVRLAVLLSVTVSRMTVLRVVMALPEPGCSVPRVLGVDEFATRRGQRYGTILLDCETHQPLDLLPDREAETLAAWLRRHPGVEIICRDRATFFAEGARDGAPDAQHCADKWHVWHNLGEAVERLVSGHRVLLRDLDESQLSPASEPEPEPEVADALSPVPYPPGRFLDRLRDTHAAVHAQIKQGLSQREIARRLGMGRHTVRKYARDASPEAMLHGQWQNRTSKLDPYRSYLEQRIAEGCTNLLQLHRELQEHGARSSYSTLRDYVHPLRPRKPPRSGRPPMARPPSPREATRWIMSHPDHLRDTDQQRLKTLLSRSPELTAAAARVRTFATIMTTRDGGQLPGWIADTCADPQCGLDTFAAGLLTDLDAVVFGMSTDWSSGPVEGRVNDLKALKRGMFGRARLPLLRKRLLLIAASRRPQTVTNPQES